MFDNNKACKVCIEKKGREEYTRCPYDIKDCHDFIVKMLNKDEE